MFLMKRKRPGEAPAFFAGLGGGGTNNFAHPKWRADRSIAEQFDCAQDVIDHAKVLFPQLVYRKQIEAVEVTA